LYRLDERERNAILTQIRGLLDLLDGRLPDAGRGEPPSGRESS
jgi:hypothetical protein